MSITKPRKEDVEAEWYTSLKRPFLYPPRWMFSPLWASVNVAVGYSSYLVWRDGDEDATRALMAYGGSLVSIAIWPIIVFRTRSLGLATVDSLAGTAFAATYHSLFAHINRTAGQLSSIGLLWALYCSYVSFSLWRDQSKKRQ
ncbi:uncharacterized protein TRIADDRAFT_26336 [Trichoplax adhaerens]|uniref:Translocator protein n=1 Tax=Trichoplax adhaerens TaxID=10228 RepID=B3S0K0_TRIAD|nr:hypothetical protein TRIADDRAFT_26336 [Trichoplax adhaerens]EDV24022.1 hypothetical protein TRIADDRAFT_26336 [Trichoplax adhaerens]|eukprot:XP_002113548.1 hypothetical protein TRIADDRAFT_26336 [Trichoplax adhaerens]